MLELIGIDDYDDLLNDWFLQFPTPQHGERTMAITIDKLIERLEDLRDELDGNGDIEVRLMHQPEWPFEYDIAGVVSSRDIREGDPDEDEDESFAPEGDADEVVYICEGRQLGYGSKSAWAAL